MAVYKREDSKYWWYRFMVNGRLYQRSTKVKNKRDAEKIEAAFQIQLARGEVGIDTPAAAPTLEGFSEDFKDFVSTRHAEKPETVRFYNSRLQRLLDWPSLRNARLNQIDEGLIARYVTQRRKKVGIVAVNRELATLRRVLHVARKWKVIKAVPMVELLKNEPSRDFVLDHAEEQRYLAACPPQLREVAILLLDSALRVGEAVALRWKDVHLEPVGSGRYGWIEVRGGKSTNARRKVPLSARAASMLSEKHKAAKSEWVFPGNTSDTPVLATSLAHMHIKVCRPGEGKKRINIFPAAFVLHSLRHTALTRLGEAGADAFTIMKLAGHSSVTISQRYVHPTGETMELAFDRLAALNRKAAEGVSRQAGEAICG